MEALALQRVYFDLPIEIPAQLKRVAKAGSDKKNIIFDICKTIRNLKNIDEIYIEKAGNVAEILELPKLFKDSKDLGQIVTFAFEDNTYFSNFVELIKAGEYKNAHLIVESNSNNIWVSCDQERSLYWNIAKLSLNIVKQINTYTDYKNFNKASELITYYAQKSFSIDQDQRQFERCILDVFNQNEILAGLISFIRKQYRCYTEDCQKVFQNMVYKEHWPIENVLSNIQVFNKIIVQEIKANEKLLI
jgi:hypothetical protein